MLLRNVARTTNKPLFDAVAQRELAVADIRFAGITDGGKAMIQPDGQTVHGPDGCLR
jgi:hypothetical protein